MKILIISWNWVEYLIEISGALAELGHEVHIAMNERRVRQTVGSELLRLVDPRVRTHLFDDRPRGLRDPAQLFTIAKIRSLIRKVGPDVMNVHLASQTYIPLILRTIPCPPIVLTVHDVTTHPGADSMEPGRRGKVRQYLRRTASAVIVHGEKLKSSYLQKFGDGIPVHSIPHGCYTTLRHWAKPHLDPIRHSVLFFGRLHEYKGFPDLLVASEKVIREVPDFKLIVAGRGSDLERHRHRLSELSYVILRDGYLSNGEVAEVFQRTTIAVLPYVEGSQSGVVRIAFPFGLPVVVTDVGSLAESVQDGKTGLVVPPRSPHLLADALIRLLKDDEERAKMSAAALEVSEAELSWSRVASDTEQVYRAVLGKSTPDQVGAHG